MALTTEEARLSVAWMQLQPLLDQLEVLRKHVVRFEAQIKKVFATHPEAGLFRDLPGAGSQLALARAWPSAPTAPSIQTPPACKSWWGSLRARQKRPATLDALALARPSLPAAELCRMGRLNRSLLRLGLGLLQAHAQKRQTSPRHPPRLAFKWIRILWKCWQERTPYDDARYARQLLRHKSPYAVTV